MEKVRELYIEARLDSTQAERGLMQLDRNATRAQGSMAGLKAGIVALGAAGVLGVFSSLVGSTIDAASQYEKFQAILTTTLGSQQQASAEMQRLSNFAAQTPFQLTDLTDGFIKFANRGLIPTNSQLQAFGDIAASQGKPIGQFNEALLDISNSERWKEFGIQSQKVGNRVRLTFKGITKEAPHTVDGVASILEEFGAMEGVSGQMANLSQTWGGMVSNLEDGVSQIKTAVGLGIMKALRPAFKWFLDNLSLVSLFFNDAEKGAGRIRFALMILAPIVGGVLVAALIAAAMAAWSFMAPFLPIIGAAIYLGAVIGALALIIEDLMVFAEGGDSAFGEFLKTLGLTGEEIEFVRKVIDFQVQAFKNLFNLIGQGLSWAWTNLLKFIRGVPGFIRNMVGFGRAVFNALTAPIRLAIQMIDLVGQKIDQMVTFLQGFGEKVRGVPGLGSLVSAVSPEARASGGPVTSGRPYLVGEQGPELFVPGQSGSIVPNGARMSRGSAPTFNITINASGDVAQTLKREVKRVLDDLSADYAAQVGIA